MSLAKIFSFSSGKIYERDEFLKAEGGHLIAWTMWAGEPIQIEPMELAFAPNLKGY